MVVKMPVLSRSLFLSRSSRFAWFPGVVLYILPQSLLNRLNDIATIHCERNFRSLPLPSADESFSVYSFWLTTARERIYIFPNLFSMPGRWFPFGVSRICLTISRYSTDCSSMYDKPHRPTSIICESCCPISKPIHFRDLNSLESGLTRRGYESER